MNWRRWFAVFIVICNLNIAWVIGRYCFTGQDTDLNIKICAIAIIVWLISGTIDWVEEQWR